MPATGSTEVDDDVPTVATMAMGRLPAARSAAMAASSASTCISNRSLTGTRTRAARPRPRVMHAFSMELCASVDAYTRSPGTSGRPVRPAAATSNPAACRAPASAMSDEVDAVSVSRPSNASGRPNACRSQSTTTCSSSVPIGDVRHSIGFWPSAAVSISPRIPGPEAVVAKYAKNPGCCQWVAFGSISRW